MDRENRKLKIGLLLRNDQIPFWAYTMFETINSSDYAEIVLVVKKQVRETPKGSLLSNSWRKRNELLFLLYQKFESFIYHPKPNAFELKNIKTILNCPEIILGPQESVQQDVFSDEEISRIKSHDLDVLASIDCWTLTGNILKSAKFGVWCYSHGDIRMKVGGPTGVWEILEGWNGSGVVLKQLTEASKSDIILHEGYYSNLNLFINRNRNNVYWKSNSLLPRKLSELYAQGETLFFKGIKTDNTQPIFYYNRKFENPKNLDFIGKISQVYWNSFKGLIQRRLYRDQWILLYKLEKTDKISQTFFEFKRMLPPKDRFWADPFILEKNDRYYIFIEELLYSENKGKIAVIEMDADGNYGPPKVVLETAYHLSYPFLIKHKGELYMLPETGQNNTIELYRCTQFPDQWELEKILMDHIKAVDSTIFEYDNKFWMFTNVQEYLGNTYCDELFLFYTDDLVHGTWTPHPQNPLNVDVRFSRPAGNVFIHENRIFRPTQNCSKHYGYGMQIMEIMTLNENEFIETHTQSIYPNWDKDLLSTHTLNHSGKLTLIDAKIYRPL